VKKLAFALLATVLGIVMLEFSFRLLKLVSSSDLTSKIEDYRNQWAPSPLNLGSMVMFAPHAHMVYTYNPAWEDSSIGGTSINELGFHFDDLALEKPPATLRIATFGGSTTGGHDSWPYWLEQQLNEQLANKRVEVLNFGVGGWNSAEGVVAYTHLARSYDLDAVVIHHVNNDIDPILQSGFKPDYRHFRRPAALDEKDGVVSLRWTLSEHADDTLTRWSDLYIYARMWTVGPPTSRWTLNNFTMQTPSRTPISDNERAQRLRVLERNYDTIGTLTEADGGRVIVLTMPSQADVDPKMFAFKEDLAAMNQTVREIGAKKGWAVVDAAADDGFHAGMFQDPIHLTVEGNSYKATLVGRALINSGFGQEPTR
jgi:hypothetical protein